MEKTTYAVSPETGDTIEAALEGGPATLSAARRRVRIAHDVEVMKVPHYGGYEHFERTETRLPGDGPVVFRWSSRTNIAE
jgi:hypothetical protein